MPHFLFLNASTRAPGQVGNTETLARRAAQALRRFVGARMAPQAAGALVAQPGQGGADRSGA